MGPETGGPGCRRSSLLRSVWVRQAWALKFLLKAVMTARCPEFQCPRWVWSAFSLFLQAVWAHSKSQVTGKQKWKRSTGAINSCRQDQILKKITTNVQAKMKRIHPTLLLFLVLTVFFSGWKNTNNCSGTAEKNLF